MAKKKPSISDSVAGLSHREKMAERMREKSAGARDIGPIPPVVNPERRAAAEASFRVFCETYHKGIFYAEWSANHLEVIEKMQETVQDGGLISYALPRGEGKTSIVVRLAEWALLTGRRSFVCMIGASKPKADALVDGVKSDLKYNAILAEDFPEVCFPIWKLEGETRRCAGQTCLGEKTGIQFGDDLVVLPHVKGSKSSGGVLIGIGIEGSIRGIHHATMDGRHIRPDFVVPDDPQTKESANSPTQTAQRISILNGDILGLAGPQTKIAGIMPCTVIRKGDMADQSLDRERCPEWQGIRRSMLESFPSNMKMWEEYRILRNEDLRSGRGELGEARKYYLENRAEMDAGAKVGWESRKTKNDVSALQYAMHLYLRDQASFFAEYQNDPQEESIKARHVNPQELAEKFSGYTRNKVPSSATVVTAFIDVQKTCLYWSIVAWEEDCTGYTLDYGVFPEQEGRGLGLRDVTHTLAKQYPGTGTEGSIASGLNDLINGICGRELENEDGSISRVKLCLIDSGWGPQTETVLDAIKRSPHAGLILPWKGYGLKAIDKPMSEWKRERGDKSGRDWVIRRAKGRRLRVVSADVNAWKCRLFDLLATAHGDHGSLSFFSMRLGMYHTEFATQICAEDPHEVTSKGGRTAIEWTNKSSRDNHFLDCMVGCLVGASIMGCKMPTEREENPESRRATDAPAHDGDDTEQAPPPVREVGSAIPQIGSEARRTIAIPNY